jgi:hypothetical protein
MGTVFIIVRNVFNFYKDILQGGVIDEKNVSTK